MSITLLAILALCGLIHINPTHATKQYTFVVSDVSYTRLCSRKSILTVNGRFPGPTINAVVGETIYANVINNATESITIHWHGVKQLRNPWSDGPEYITQCPIKPRTSFNQSIVLSNEIGTLWWHAHSEWSRATVHGMIIVKPETRTEYPFAIPHNEFPVIIGEWWKSDIKDVASEFVASGGEPNTSDAFLINGRPGGLHPCSGSSEFTVESGKTYLLRIVNAVMVNIMFFKVANHSLTTVASDGAYVKNFTSSYITISPGQTIDCLFTANQFASQYYMAARAYFITSFGDRTPTTAILKYKSATTKTTPVLPIFPNFDDTAASINYTVKLRSLATPKHPIEVPKNIKTKLFFTLSINRESCGCNSTCTNGERSLASMNNISFKLPTRTSILGAYYKHIAGVYDIDFPHKPPTEFNYTADDVPSEYFAPTHGTKVIVLEYNSTVEIVLQGTNVDTSAIDHPMHLHGQSFYVVGSGLGNFNKVKDPRKYNLVDPPLMNTIAVPKNGWTTVRFKASNPGVWFMHCHIENHLTWGMKMSFITKNGKTTESIMLPAPLDFPKCT